MLTSPREPSQHHIDHAQRACAPQLASRGTKWHHVGIPDSVVEVGEGCFSACASLRSVSFGGWSKLECMCAQAFYGTSIGSLSIPRSVIDLTNGFVLHRHEAIPVIDTVAVHGKDYGQSALAIQSN